MDGKANGLISPRGSLMQVNPPATFAACTSDVEVQPPWYGDSVSERITETEQSKPDEQVFGMKNTTRIATWNVRTMYEEGRLEQVVREMRKYNIEILGVQEARWTGNGEHRSDNGTVFLYSGREEGDGHMEGVGLFLTPKAKRGLIEWHPLSSRIILCRIKCRARNVCIINCYAPTETRDDATKDDFYSQLNNCFSYVRSGDILFVMGDFNAKVGSLNAGLERIIGKHGLGSRNDNGERFIEFCGSKNMVIGGTLFPHKTTHKITWVSPDGNTQNQIDHVAIKRIWRTSLLNVRSMRGADVGSDHHLVVATLRIKLAAIKKSLNEMSRRFDVDKLKSHDIEEAYKIQLRNRFEALQDSDVDSESSQSLVDKINTIYNDVGQTVLGYTSKRRKKWISQSTWEKVDQRKATKRQLNDITRETSREYRDELRRKYTHLMKEVKKSTRLDKRNKTNNIARSADEAAARHDIRGLYQIIRELSGRRYNNTKPVKDKDGNLLTNESDQIKRWAEHFKETLNSSINNQDYESAENVNAGFLEINSLTRGIRTSAPSRLEVVNAIKALKNNKSPGKDNICAEFLKVDTQLSADIWLPVIVKIWESEEFPQSWNEGVLVKIPKKGSVTDCNNWRGITLLPIPSKLITKIIQNRIFKSVEDGMRKEQYGFRPNRSCTDLINTIRIIFEQCNEYQTTIYTTFVDFKKAFDSLDRSFMWGALRRRGVPEKIVKLIVAMYDGFKCSVLHNGKLSEPFDVLTGVRQGCILSPLLFIVVLDEILADVTRSQKRGITWSLTDHLEDLDYADDICLLSHRFNDMQEKLNILSTTAKRSGLIINSSKTKEMRSRHNNQSQLELDGEVVEKVSSFVYLGSTITCDGGAAEDINTRINKARSVFAQLHRVWKSNQIATKTKIRLFNSNVKSVLFYGCETWKCTASIESKIQTFINRCLRRILKIRWPAIISNAELWRQTNQSPAAEEIMHRKWTWIGHTLRKNDSDIAKQAMRWNPQGSRRRGRPATTWRISVDAELKKANKNWSEIRQLAKNRTRWRCFVSALCSTRSRLQSL